MRITDYRAWLKINGAKSGNISDKISNAKRVDEHYGNLDSHFNKDGLATILELLSTDGIGAIKHDIPINSREPQNVTSSLKSAITSYQKFCQECPPISKSFRHNAGFGKRMEFWIIGEMLRHGLDVYIPLVDDRGVDAVVRRDDGSFAEVQIKARSNDVATRDAALFAAIPHEEMRPNYWFIFYSARLDTTWIMSSSEFIEESNQNKKGNNVGKRSIWFNGCKMNKSTGKQEEYVHDRFKKYICNDFSRLTEVGNNGVNS